jgi:SPX domain protein involved in polyphosphate accumulation
MHFGKTLEARRSPRFARGYLEYDYLKRTLKVIVADPTKLSSFVSLLESEIARVDRFAAARVEDAKVAVSQLSRHVGGLSPSRASTEEIHAAEAQAAEVSAMLVDLNDFLALNRTAVSKLVKKHDKMTGFTTRAWVMARLDASGFLAHSLDGFLVALSDMYARLRLLREPQAEDGGGVWAPPESFQRETTKVRARARG